MIVPPAASIAPLASVQRGREPQLATVQTPAGTAFGLIYLDGRVSVEWTLSDDERRQIAMGENVRLWLWTDRKRAPAIHMEVTSVQKP